MPSAPIRDIMTYYEEAGSGEPLVLIMGLGGDLQGWAFQVPVLAQHFRVITFDNRGAGRTSAPDRPYSIAGMAEDVVALMDRIGVAKAHVLGFSMGGFIAQELALAHPERVGKLILLATAAGADGYMRNVVTGMVNARSSSMSREEQVRLMATFVYSAALFDDEARFEASIQNALNNPYAQQDHAFIRQAAACLGFDSRNRLPALKHETLVVSGAEDILVPPRHQKELAQLLANATFKELPGGHVGCIEMPLEYNAAFLEFLGVSAKHLAGASVG